MRVRKHIRPTVSLAVPAAASQVSNMLVHTADAIMVGTLGAASLGAVALAGSVTVIFVLFAAGFSLAITPLAGEAIGRGDMRDASKYVRAGMYVSFLITLVIVAGLIAASPWFSVLGSPSDVTELAIPYFRWVVASALFRIAFGGFRQTAEALSNTRAAMTINIAINVLNVALNWVFIYGNLGVPAMGVEGAGIATFIASGVSLIPSYWLYRYSKIFAPIRGELSKHISWSILKQAVIKILRDGFGIGMQITVEIFGFASGAVMIGWIGTSALAAHNVAMNVASITFMVALGLGSAATIRISTLRGEGRHRSAFVAAKTALIMVVVYMLGVAAAYALLRFQIPLIYIGDAAVIELAATLLLWAGLFSLFDGLQVVSLGILRGYNDIKVPTYIAIISYLAITVPVGYYAAFVLDLGPEGIWLGYLTGLGFASSAYILRIRSITK